MCLKIDIDAAYIVQPKSFSRDAGHYCLSDTTPPPTIWPNPNPNSPILTKFHPIRTVMSSAADTETGAIFLNGQKAVPIHTALLEMGHHQTNTPIKTYNKIYHEILTGNMRRKRSKTFDMTFN